MVDTGSNSSDLFSLITNDSFKVCIKIEAPGGDAPKMIGRHFDEKDLLMSRVSSI